MNFKLFGYYVTVERAPFDYEGWSCRRRDPNYWSATKRYTTMNRPTIKKLKADIDAENQRERETKTLAAMDKMFRRVEVTSPYPPPNDKVSKP